MSGIQLFVGLANPGKEYENTRHNAGAWFIDELAKQLDVNLRSERKFHGLYTATKSDHHACELLIPTTFMNLSGKSVHACMQYHKITPDMLLVAHDDIDLPVGVMKLKYDGGDGGHNGLKDIISHLHTKQFYRLRIGVGRPVRKDVVDYVLEPPSKADRQLINDGIERALSIVPLLLEGKMQIAMQNLHTAPGESNGT